MTRYFVLSHTEARRRALVAVQEADDGHTVTVAPPRRNSEQNALLHALLSDISKSVTWAGQKWSTDDWKRLLTAAWLRARSEGVSMVPAVDGRGFDVLYRHTSSLSRRECAELIDYVTAWAVENGAALKDQPAEATA